jgi:zinc protease
MQWHKDYESALLNLTVDEVNKAFKRHLSLDKISIITAGDAQKITAQPLKQ